MSNTNLDLQTELFEEFKDREPHHQKADNNAPLKNTKIVIPLDTMVTIILMLIFIVLTAYFFGVYRGKSITQKTYITVEKTNPTSLSQIGTKIKKETIQEKQETIQTTDIKPKPVNERVKETLSQIAREKKQKHFKKYTIQVGASQDGKAAQKDADKLHKKGYDAFLIPYFSSTGKQWYKICVGRFEQTKDAHILIKKLKSSEGKKDCFLTNVSS